MYGDTRALFLASASTFSVRHPTRREFSETKETTSCCKACALAAESCSGGPYDSALARIQLPLIKLYDRKLEHPRIRSSTSPDASIQKEVCEG